MEYNDRRSMGKKGLVSASSISILLTLPAQNALLKLVEEPPPNTQLILAAYPGRELLPTLVSRCREIIWTESNNKPTASSPPEQESLKKFLIQPEAFSYSELIDLAETF